MTMIWRLLRSGEGRGATNMALDETLLDAVAAGASPPVLRLYRWRPAAVSLGYAQDAEAAVRAEACREAGIDVVRRISGGRAVFHHREVTYAVAAPTAGPFAGGVGESYRRIALALQAALAALGVKAELAPGRGGETSGICFAAPSRYELAVAGRKVTGSAQKRIQGAFLQHGSIPLDLDLELLSGIFPPGPREDRRRALAKVGWLNLWARPEVTAGRLEEAVVRGFREALGIRLVEDGPSPAEREQTVLLEERYASPEWTFRRGGRTPGEKGELS